MKTFKKIMVIIAKVIFAIIAAVGTIAVSINVVLDGIFVVINTHKGIVNMPDNDAMFCLVSLLITCSVFLIGTLGFFKSDDLLKKLSA